MKIITSKFHAILDFVLIIALLASPSIFELSSSAATLCYALGVIHFLLTIITDFSGGIFKIVNLKLHGLVEVAVSILLVILAFTFFKGNLVDEIYFACLGLLILIIFTLTDYQKTPPLITR
ncbi:hypothetical protein [Pedobacter sp.]|uniref:hypothetical protein n=1 Tax=Pedobacter sp. TaxID=1411316 RepID=UPI0012269091|nr:MAG: hypothetical protein EOO93_26065 [Pedobacter sp.]